MGDIGIFLGGLTGKNKYDFENGNKYYVPYKNIFSNIEVDLENLEKVKIGNEKQNELKFGDILFTGSSENLEECGLTSVITKEVKDIYLNSFCFIYRFNEDIKILPSFSKYLFRDKRIRKKIIKTSNGVTRFNVSKTAMKNILIPIHPLPVQHFLVRILDKFDKLTNDISGLLPYEIELREKQYEYYRDKLLNFKEI